MSSDYIKTAQKQYKRLIDLLATEEIKDNCGRLLLDRRGDNVYCYKRTFDGSRQAKKEYIGTWDSAEVREYCSNEYRRELRRRLTYNISLLEKVMAKLMDCSADSVVGSLPNACQQAMKNFAAPREYAFLDTRYEELKEWASAGYEKNTMDFSAAENYAKDGTRVRSKGECIIYNILLDRGIPFRYDSIIDVTDRNGRTKQLSPDFMIQCFDGTFIIVEHLGQLGDSRYAINYGDKCYWYLHYGFVPGKNFFITSDDINYGTDSKAISETLSRIERLFYGY